MNDITSRRFSSLCILSYERPDFLKRSIESLKRNTRARHEIIVNDDGSENQNVLNYIADLQLESRISYAIYNSGKNMGVGKALRNCIGVSSGDYIFKLDADLEYTHRWLEKAVSILNNHNDVGCVGLFDYLHYDPKDKRFKHIEERNDCFIVEDFVNSGYGFKRSIYEKYGKELGDDGWQQYVKSQGYKLAIPKGDLVINFGFGEGKSVYVQNGQAIPSSKSPRIFQCGRSE
jgi:glycosyltransferase involved in cell wall biosynthesis